MSKLPAALPLDQQLCFSVYLANIAINRMYRPMLDALGVTYPQYLVLSALWEADGQSVGSIADRLALESSTVTPLVKRLELSGFVGRQRNPADERQVIVSLTAKGRDLHQQSKCLTELLLERSSLSVPGIISLNKEIGALVQALGGSEDRAAETQAV